MNDESRSFTAAKSRLDEIVTQVRKKDTSLEKSLDLLEEGVRLANVCTELIDQTDWTTASDGSTSAPVSELDSDAEPHAPAMDGDSTSEAVLDAESPAQADESVGDEVPAADEPPVVGEVWSEDEAWADEAEDDPSDGDDGHGA